MSSLKNWLDRLLGRDKGTAEDVSSTTGEPTDMASPRAGDVDEAPTYRDESVDRESRPPPGTG
jgi:hypothetical protein